MRVNSTILSLYPFLFHVCFMIFHWCSTVEVLIVTELVCLSVYVAGVIHHSLTVVFEVLRFIYECCAEMSKKNQVAVQRDKKRSQSQEKKVIKERSSQKKSKSERKPAAKQRL